MQDLQTPLDAARRWRSWKVTKRDLAVERTRHHRARLLKYYPGPPCVPNRECFGHYKHISYFFNKYSLSLYVYSRGMLGCLLGFWRPDQNHAGAIRLCIHCQ